MYSFYRIEYEECQSCQSWSFLDWWFNYMCVCLKDPQWKKDNAVIFINCIVFFRLSRIKTWSTNAEAVATFSTLVSEIYFSLHQNLWSTKRIYLNLSSSGSLINNLMIPAYISQLEYYPLSSTKPADCGNLQVTGAQSTKNKKKYF